jgi:hypothetical protein
VAVYQLFTDVKKAYQVITRKVLCKCHIEFDLSMKLVRLNKMSLNCKYI